MAALDRDSAFGDTDSFSAPLRILLGACDVCGAYYLKALPTIHNGCPAGRARRNRSEHFLCVRIGDPASHGVDARREIALDGFVLKPQRNPDEV